jgi:two-component system sensor histidine kinase HydH
MRGVVVGPFLPGDAIPGAIVIMRKLPAPVSPDGASIAIALHVRLSSLTELMGRDNLGGLIQPLLLTPQGISLTSVGSPSAAKAKLARQLDVLPGWSIALADNASRLEQPLSNIREPPPFRSSSRSRHSWRSSGAG